MKTYQCIGIMTGSSLDGMDVVYVKVKEHKDGYKILKLRHLFQRFDPAFRAMARKIGSENLLYESALFSMAWSSSACKAIFKMLRKYSIPIHHLDVIGVHGQTVIHRPNPVRFLHENHRCTIQLANLSYIAEKTGITTIGNFRQRDMVVGGQGAPLMPYMHKLLYGANFNCLSVHNLGGISNATILENQNVVSAFDTGPANIWIDTVVRWRSGNRKHLDKNGMLAKKGTPHAKLVAELLTHPYFRKKPPKSTGWEEFGDVAFSKYKSKLARLSIEDAVATVTAATVQSIVDAYKKFVMHNYDIEAIIFTGGGARNSFMLQEIQRKIPNVKVQTSETYNIAVHETEALGFALLGLENLLGRPGNAPEATGASKHVLCGEIAAGDDRKHVDRIRRIFQSKAR